MLKLLLAVLSTFTYADTGWTPTAECPSLPCMLEGGVSDSFHSGPTCPAYTPVLRLVEFNCGKMTISKITPGNSLAYNMAMIATAKELGPCAGFAARMYLQDNHLDRKRDVSSEGDRVRRKRRSTIKSMASPLVVILVIDMDVSDEHYWSTTMPAQIKAHLAEVNFPVGTTFEIVLAGPDNIYVHYPISKPEQDLTTDEDILKYYSSTFTYAGRRRRSVEYCKGGVCDMSGGLKSNEHFACEIKDKHVLFERLSAAIASTPALPKSLYSALGLSRPDHIRWISAYLHKFLPISGRALVMHVINHDSQIDHSDIAEYQGFIGRLEANRPNLQILHHFMFAGTSAPMAARLVELGVTQTPYSKWSVGLTNSYVTTMLMTVGGTIVPPAVGGITDTVVAGQSCKGDPCQNGCTCQQSCRDENDYVCIRPPGRPFVGKNCEWEAVVQCTADRSIRVSIPTAAVSQYAMGVNNVVVQGCNNAPSYICNDNPSCGPALNPTGGFYVLECNSNSFTNSNGQWTFGQTIIFDRASNIVSMPHPIVKVECLMQTRPATSVIRPELRGPQGITQTIFWQPMFGFYKTKWGDPMILANNGNQLPNGAVGYIIGERIHVRITATLNGVPSVTLPNQHAITVSSCSITPGGGVAAAPIQIISGGVAVVGTPFPISVDHDPGTLGGGATSSSEGVAFSFQVFTFGPGSTLQLTCTVNINGARRRRSAGNVTDPDTETIIAELLLFERAEEEKNDIPTLAMQQDEIVEVVYMEATESTPEGRAIEIEEIALSELPTWFLCLLASLVVLTMAFSISIYKRRYATKSDFDDADTKVRLFN